MNEGLSEGFVDSVRAEPVGGRIGAEIRGIDLSGRIDAAALRTVREALLRYKVLFFRDQFQLDDGGHERFAALMGEPMAHPTLPSVPGTRYVLAVDSEHTRTNAWHTDATFVAAYPMCSILRAVTLPPFGGDTMFANTALAYSDMPSALQELAVKLWGLHSNNRNVDAMKATSVFEGERAPGRSAKHAKYSSQLTSTVFETEHPVVRVHPETGERTLVLGNFLQRILGLSADDSDRVVAIFQAHVTRLENTVRWRWRPGDVAMWDNRATQHYAIDDYGSQKRLMHRVTVHGDVPLSVDGRRSASRQLSGGGPSAM